MQFFKIPANKYNRRFWIIFISPVIILLSIMVLASTGLLGHMPKIEDLENPKIDLATLIISTDGNVLGNFYYMNENRTHVDFERLPKHLVDALIATEDIRFYKHSGIDAKGLARAVILNGILGKRSAGGGSTITQQLAKLLFHTPPETTLGRLKQKFKEWIIAIKLEKAYTKEEIIALYFNQYDFLYSAVGIESASKVYFNTSPDSLTIDQSAMLVGMAKNHVLYNPKRFPEKALARRNTVLRQMKKYNYLTSEQCDSLLKVPVELEFQQISHNEGLATYFREFIKLSMTAQEPQRKDYSKWNYNAYQTDSSRWKNDPLYGWCNKNIKSDGSVYDLFADGLRIYTTIDSKLQQYAEEAMAIYLGGYLQPEFFNEKKGRKRAPFAHNVSNKEIDKILRHAIRYSERGTILFNKGVPYKTIYKEFQKPVKMTIFTYKGEKDTIMSPLDSILYYKHFLHSGLMSMDPATGYVRAYVGGLNFKYFKYDHVTHGKRQAGSTFKPFLYILAMQEGFSPCRMVPVVPITFYVNDTTWSPRSTCKKHHVGTMKPLKWGLALSENYISAWLVDQFKPQPIADIAYKMGIKSYIDPVPAMIYGTSDVSVAEMTSAYSTFANKGVNVEPLFVTRIEDKYGNILATFLPETHEAISEETAYLMLNLMEGATNFGTAVRLRFKYNFTAQISSKTGTTNNNSDGWFMGITPKLVTGIWVGADDRSVHFDNTAMGSGTNMALPIWAEYMLKVYEDEKSGILQTDRFIRPSKINYSLDCDSIRNYKDPEFEEDIDATIEGF